MIAPATFASPHPASPLGRRIAARIIDDGILVALTAGLAAAITTVADNRAAGHPQAARELLGFDGALETDLPSIAAPVMVAFLLLGALAYYLWASAADGRTMGRRAWGLKVVCTDGRAAPWRLLLGREVLRFGLLSLIATLAWISLSAFRDTANDVLVEGDLLEILNASAVWMPAGLVGAVWIGAVLVDPHGRAPHDRIAGTLVVRANRWDETADTVGAHGLDREP